ncbi:MAG: PKD domain-containing protein [Saprospiraceae bacterium]|nr:PKD domain-containing protein [Saprospiraceae bacterium]
MKSRFYPLIFCFITLLSLPLAGQNQDSLIISGIAYPTCSCDGFIDITVTGGASQPPPSYYYLWGNGSTTQDIFGLCPGLYTVTVGSNNTNTTATATFVVQQIPFIPLDIISSNLAPCNFDSSGIFNDCEKVCPGATVTYSVNIPSPGGTGSMINWQVSGATSWTVNNPFSPNSSVTVVWGGPGIGSVTVFSDGSQGCVGESALCVTVVDEPIADFETSPAAAIAGSPLQICIGQTVQFKNLSTGDAEFYEWWFSDDFSTTAEVNPSHTYLLPGLHTVRLVASSGCLCSDTTEITIEVLNAQAPTLDCVSTVCPGETATYTASNACPPFSWTVSGNGTILNGGTATSDSISVQWNDGPVGAITLSAAPCSGAACPTGGVIEIPIISNNAEIEGQVRVCPGATEVYTIEPFGGGTGFTWTLPQGGNIIDGQGTNRVVVEWNSFPNPAPAADHTLYVQYENCYLGCGGEDLIHVRILSAFSVNGPVEACENSSGNFSARLNFNNALIPCNWTLFAPDGTVSWTSAAATATPAVPFQSGAGTYRLLAVPNDPNTTCSDEAEWVIAVRALPAEPTAIDGITDICPGGTYTYEALGLGAGANIRWIVKNGAPPAQTTNGNPLNVTWAAAGPYWLSAAQVSTDGLGCLSDTVGLVMTAIAAPVITGTAVVCEDNKGVYAIQNFQNVNIQWSIGPSTAGAIADGQGTDSIEIFWNQPGGHVVNVSVCGQTALLPVTVLANPDPVPVHPAGLCPGETAIVTTADGYSSYAWKNAAGNTISTLAAPILGPGVYSIEVVDANGCSGAARFAIASWDAPDISLTTADPTGFCNNSYTVSLFALSNSDADYTYQWLQDGNPIGGATGVIYFTNQYGNFSVQASNSYGCSTTAGPLLLFNYCDPTGSGNCSLCNGQPYCAPGTIQAVADLTPRCDSFVMVLNDYSGLYIPGSAEWKTGISGGPLLFTAMGDNPSFIYPNAGKYLISVLVQLSDGTACYALDSLDVEAVADFDELPGCPGDVTEFENNTEFLPEFSNVQYAWNFGDPASGAANLSGLQDPDHAYASAGIYDVVLTVTAPSGCTSIASHAVEIPQSITPAFLEPAARCAGNALEFIATQQPGVIELTWDFGDPLSGPSNDAGGDTVYHNYTAGAYTVTATSVNAHGCTATFTRTFTVEPNLLSGNITPANPGPICEGSSLTLTAPGGGVSYSWSDDNQTSTQSLTVSKEGSYSVTITDVNGCTYVPPAVNVEINPSPDALIKALLFNALGQIIGTSYPTVTICEGEDLALQAVSNGAATYSWSGGNGSNQVLYFTEDRNTLLPVGTHLFTVTVTNPATGCTAVSDPFIVTVHPKPDGFWVSSNSYCAGDPNVINYNGPTPPNWQIIWNTGELGTSITTEDAGVYFVAVVNEFGCAAESNKLAILPGPPIGSVPAGCHTRCSPDTLCLPNLPTVISWQWYLDGNPIPGATSPNFIAQQSGTYWAEMMDIYGCSANSDPLSLNLYTGYGNVLGNVWSDVNNNNIIDPADTLVPGITVVVYQNGVLYGAVVSDAEGDFALTNVLSTGYSFSVDPFSLPPNWSVIIGTDNVTLSGCNVEGSVDFLLNFGCTAFGTLQLNACPGGFATYNGTNISVGGSHTFYLTSVDGCDSTLVVSVVALPVSTSTLTLNACPNGTVNYDGTELAVGDVQNFTFANWLGCDSVVTVSVTALPVSSSALTLNACPNGTVNYDGTELAVGDVQNFTFANWLGCDSVVTVSVAALPVSSSALTLHACPGGTVNYQGNALADGTVQDFTYSNFVGCDSVVTVTVVGDLPVSSSAFSVGVCPGETYVYEGVTLQAGAVQTFTLTNFAGCDSMVTVTVFQKNNSSNVLQVTVCPGETYSFMGQNIAPGDSREFHLLNGEGCDSTLTIFVTAFPATTFAVAPEPSCSNTPTGELSVNSLSGGPTPYRFSLDNVNFQDETRFSDLSPGDYTVYVEDANGCVFEQNAALPAIPKLELQLANGILPCDSAGVQMQALVSGGDPATLEYLWWNGGREAGVTATEAGTVWVEVSDACETVRREATVQWAELAQDIDIVYIPNIFAPASNDGENARFKPYFASSITLLGFHFEVFDRWGNKLFETSNTADAWDGVFRTQNFNPGVQVWHLEADVAICGRVLHVQRKGDVTVLR